MRTVSSVTSGYLRTGGALVGSFLFVVSAYVVFHESIHVGINWLLAGELADRCGPLPIVLDPSGRYLAVCYADGGDAGVNAAATLALSGLLGGAVAVAADREVEDLTARTGLLAGATASTLHLGSYLANTGTVAGSTVPSDTATVIATVGIEWLLPAILAVLLSTVAIASCWWRLWPPLRTVVADRTIATDGGRSRSK